MMLQTVVERGNRWLSLVALLGKLRSAYRSATIGQRQWVWALLAAHFALLNYVILIARLEGGAP